MKEKAANASTWHRVTSVHGLGTSWKWCYLLLYYNSLKSQRIFGAASTRSRPPHMAVPGAGPPAPPLPGLCQGCPRWAAHPQHPQTLTGAPRASSAAAAPRRPWKELPEPPAPRRPWQEPPEAPARPQRPRPRGLPGPPARARRRPRRRRCRPLGSWARWWQRQRGSGPWRRRRWGTRSWEPAAGLWPPSAQVRGAPAEPRHRPRVLPRRAAGREGRAEGGPGLPRRRWREELLPGAGGRGAPGPGPGPGPCAGEPVAPRAPGGRSGDGRCAGAHPESPKFVPTLRLPWRCPQCPAPDSF